MSADLLALLDQLDEARAAATPGPWGLALNTLTHATVASGALLVTGRIGKADAALIVAAVNAAPKLTAALRAVLELADEWDGRFQSVHPDWIRGAITDALTPEPVQP